MAQDDLKVRLNALQQRAPGPSRPPMVTVESGWRRRLLRSTALAPVLLLGLGVTTLAAAGFMAVTSHPGAENPGQPLAGAQLECMTPQEAEDYLTSRGFTDVIWQVETGSVAKGLDLTSQQVSAPDHGFVVPGAFLNDGSLIMIVDQRVGATPVGTCSGDVRR